jgi:hypothetical protein
MRSHRWGSLFGFANSISHSGGSDVAVAKARNFALLLKAESNGLNTN